MRNIIAPAILVLSTVAIMLASPVRHVRAQEYAHNFVYNAVCDPEPDFPTPTNGPSAWFLIPEANEALQRASEHGAPSAPLNEVWIDLSLANNGFAPGTFIGAGPFTAPSSGTLSFIWQGLLPGRVHYYRLNARVGDQWFLIGSGAFQMPDCATPLHQTDCYTAPNGGAFFVVSSASANDRGIAASQQWLDLSLSNNDFVEGTFIGTGPLPPTGASFQWAGILPGLAHYYRVNVNYGSDGWKTAAAGAFLSLDCRGLPQNISLPL